jgi:putative restriction endonuclease
VRYLPQEAFVANTDRAWFDFFAGRSRDGQVDEVNFWLPRATTPMREMNAGELIFFRLKKPDYAIAGYGFFAHFQALDLDLAWQTLGEKNGDPTRERFFDRIGRYRGIDLLLPTSPRAPIGCTICATPSSGLRNGGSRGRPIATGTPTSCRAARSATRRVLPS